MKESLLTVVTALLLITGGIRHPDDMSGIILTSFYRHLNGRDILLDQQIEEYQSYWKDREQFEHRAVPEADILKYLVEEQGMDINRPDRRGHAPIVFIYEELDEPIAYDILQYALDKARRFDNRRILELLKAEGVP